MCENWRNLRLQVESYTVLRNIFWFIGAWEGVTWLADNLAQEIREQEAAAKSIVSDAKAEAAKMIAAAQTQAEQSD